MTFDELTGWKRITEQIISDNGKWIGVKTEPWSGDPAVCLYPLVYYLDIAQSED